MTDLYTIEDFLRFIELWESTNREKIANKVKELYPNCDTIYGIAKVSGIPYTKLKNGLTDKKVSKFPLKYIIKICIDRKITLDEFFSFMV